MIMIVAALPLNKKQKNIIEEMLNKNALISHQILIL